MAYEVVMPKMGESIVEGTIIDWKKSVGDFVSKDETLLEISTDKVDSEIPSPCEGILLKILFEKNETIPVGEVIALIGEEGEACDDKKSIERTDEEPITKQDVKVLENNNKTIDAKKSLPKDRKFYSPLVKSIAKKEGIDLSELDKIQGSGVNGRVNKQDILEYISAKDKKNTDNIGVSVEPSLLDKVSNIEPMSHIRKIIASHMSESIKKSPHVYSSVEVDVTPIVKYVKRNKDRYLDKYDLKLTYTPIFIESCIKAIQKYPLINSSIIDDDIHYHKNINLGVAVALENNELIVPVVKSAEEKNFLGLLRSLSDLAARARDGKLDPSEATGSTFTLTNPGVFGSLFGMGIINQPNVAILSTGSIEKKPIVKETQYGDAIFIRNVMYLTLGYDHRIIDGAYGSKFLVAIKESLESYIGNVDE